MDLELLIHGVPDGQDYYGIKEEQTNMGLSYDNSTESVKFVVETKKQGNTAYTYYSYLKYKGMIGSGGRPGSYFGLTLRIDKYYQDALHIYGLLDILFKRYIIGTLLAPSGDGYKYIVSNFATKSAEIDKAQQALIQLIQTTCVNAKFLDIDASFIRPITNAPAGNINDVTDSAILASIKEYSKVVLSPDYESNIEKVYKQKLQEAEGKGGNIVAQKDKTIAEKESTIKSLNTTISSQQSKIASLEQEVRQKNSDIQQLKQKGDLAQVVAKLKEPITSLADYFHLKDPKPLTPKYGYKNFRLGIISCGLSVIILALCLITLLKTSNTSSQPKDNKDIKELQEQIKSFTDTNNQLKATIKLKNDTIADLRANQSTQGADSRSATPKTLFIDISGWSNGQKLKVNQQYTVTIKYSRKPYEDGGKWEITNAELVQGSNVNQPQIKIKPNGNGRVTLKYKPSNNIDKCENKSADIESATTTTTTQPEITFEIKVEPDVTEVEIGKEYTFTISGYDGKGTWAIDGFSTQDDKSTSPIKVTAIDTGKGNTSATISYTPQGGTKKKRTFNYKKTE